jgi:signal peptidase I
VYVQGEGDAPVEGDAEETSRAAERSATRDLIARIAVEWIKSILVAFVLFLFIRTFLVEAYRIPTGSMERTLLAGDFLLVDKTAFGAHIPLTRARLPARVEPQRGDIVVFVPPHLPDQNYVKRLIGMPGDTVEMRNRVLYLDGAAVTEPYVVQGHQPDSYAGSMAWQCEYLPATMRGDACRPTRDNWGPVVVPAGRYLMLGDHRERSEDSRYWGFIDRDAMIGRPLIIYYSFQPSSPRDMPWFTAIRWDRIGDRPR